MFRADSFTHCLNIEHLGCRTKFREGMKHNRIMSWPCLVDFRFKDKLWLQYFGLGGSSCFFFSYTQQKYTYFICVCLSLKGHPIFFFIRQGIDFLNAFILQFSWILTTPSSDMKQIFEIDLLIERTNKTRNAHFFSYPLAIFSETISKIFHLLFFTTKSKQFCNDQIQPTMNPVKNCLVLQRMQTILFEFKWHKKTIEMINEMISWNCYFFWCKSQYVMVVINFAISSLMTAFF